MVLSSSILLAVSNLQPSMACSDGSLLMFVRLLPAFAKQFGVDFEDALFNFILKIDVWNLARIFELQKTERCPLRAVTTISSLDRRPV